MQLDAASMQPQQLHTTSSGMDIGMVASGKPAACSRGCAFSRCWYLAAEEPGRQLCIP
jgi:hypothetical protein